MKLSTWGIIAISIASPIAMTACSSSNSSPALSVEENTSESAAPIDGSQQTQGNTAGTSNTDSLQMGDGIADNTPPFRLDFVGFELLERLGGYSLDSLAERISVIADLATSTAIGETELESGALEIIDQDETVSMPVIRTQYQCAFGGEILIEKVVGEFWGASYSRDLNQTAYRFDQCILSLGAEQVINGSFVNYTDTFFANRSSSAEQALDWENFTWVQDDGPSVVVHASIHSSDVQEFDTNASRTAKIDRYESSMDGTVTDQINDGQFVVTNSTSEAGDVRGYYMKADGQVIDQSGVAVNIVTDPAMSRKLVFGGVNVDPILFNGQITMSADDASQLILEATSTSDTSTLQVNSTYVNSAGEVTSETNINFVNLNISAN